MRNLLVEPVTSSGCTAILQHHHQADRPSILEYTIWTSYTYTYICSSTKVRPYVDTFTSLTSFYVAFGDRTQIYIDIIACIDYCPLTQGPIIYPPKNTYARIPV